MFDFFQKLTDTAGFPPRWLCGSAWQEEPALGWLHIVCDLLVFGAYLAIPCLLILFGVRRRNLPFRWMFWLFGAFILACGTGHLIEAIIFWHPIYRISGVVKVVTALASWGTVIALVPVLPKALAMRSREELEKEIRDRGVAEVLLRESEARFRGLLDAAPDGIVIFGADGRIQLVNAQTEQMLGADRENLLGKTFSELLPARLRSWYVDFRVEFFKAPHYRPMGEGLQLFMLRADGGEVPVEISLSPLQSEIELLAIVSIRDITERIRIKQRLFQAERLAGIGQTVTGLAHEGRNALQQIQSCVEMLRLKKPLDNSQATLLRTIEQSQDRLNHLFEEVRAYAAPVNLERKPTELRGICQSAWEQLSAQRADRQATLTLAGAIDGECAVDRYQMEQVFRNIFENSLAACADPVKIEVRAETAICDGQPALTLHVSDNGPGIKPADRAKVFDAFYTTKTQGTGLGLAICKRIVEAHRGWIEVADHTAAGAAISLCLPNAANDRLPQPAAI